MLNEDPPQIEMPNFSPLVDKNNADKSMQNNMIDTLYGDFIDASTIPKIQNNLGC